MRGSTQKTQSNGFEGGVASSMRARVLLLSSYAFLSKTSTRRCSLYLHAKVNPESFRRTRAWRRLRHLIDLICPESRTVVDIGTDHGLLALALASSNQSFHSVIGVDQSERALLDGAFTLPKLPQLTFRHGDGLTVLRQGEADTVCIAGMGVYTMTTILGATDKDGNSLLDELQTRQLVLQPTNSRPRNLYRLYTNLQQRGWQLEKERIEYLSKRWYVSASFERKEENAVFLLPGEKLMEAASSQNDKRSKPVRTWVMHHCAWMAQDQARQNQMHAADVEWLSRFAEMVPEEPEKN